MQIKDDNKSFEERIGKETDTWEKQGIISSGQRQKILTLYPAGISVDEEHNGRLISTLTVLGAILLGVGVILFIASNWQTIPRTYKLVLIFGAIITSYALGYWLEYQKQNYPRVGQALIFLGTIFYGAAIWLIAQIFHINSHYPNGVLFWAVGILPMAWLCRSQAILTLTSLLIVLWTGMEQGDFRNHNYFYLVITALIFPLIYQLRSRLALAITLLGMFLWMGISSSLWIDNLGNSEIPIILMLMMLAFLIYQAGIFQLQKWQEKYMSFPPRLIGLLGIFLTMFILTFHTNTWNNYSYAQLVWLISMKFLIPFVILTLLVIMVSVYNYKLVKGNKVLEYQHVLTLLFIAVIDICALNPYILSGNGFSIAFNLILFFAIIGLLLLGYKKGDTLLINVSLLFFVIDVISRYFDFFWKLMPRSVFFMIGGVLLLAGGTFLERSRRKLLKEARAVNNESQT